MGRESTDKTGQQPLLVPARTLFWIGMPIFDSDKPGHELLKYDIMLKPVPVERTDEFIEKYGRTQKPVLFLISFDQQLFRHRTTENFNREKFTTQFAARLKENRPERIFLHTKVIDPALNNIFAHYGIKVLDRNMHEYRTMIGIVIKLAETVYKNQPQAKSTLRVRYPDDNNVQVSLEPLNSRGRSVKAILRELRVHSMTFRVINKSEAGLFGLKDFTSISLKFPRFKADINRAVIVGTDTESGRLDVAFSLSNNSMLNADAADHLTDILYNHINDSEFKELTEKN